MLTVLAYRPVCAYPVYTGMLPAIAGMVGMYPGYGR